MTNYTPSVDALANEIRRVDGSHSLGAGALAEALSPWLDATIRAAQAEAWARGEATGWSRAMRHMSDEPKLGRQTVNPYEESADV